MIGEIYQIHDVAAYNISSKHADGLRYLMMSADDDRDSLSNGGQRQWTNGEGESQGNLGVMSSYLLPVNVCLLDFARDVVKPFINYC